MKTPTQLSKKVVVAVSCGIVVAGLTAFAAEEPAKWDTSAAVGFTLTRGNSDTLLFTGDVQSTKKQDPHEFSLGANVSYGESDGLKNNESARAFGQYNRLFTERMYGYGRVDFLYDAIADVDYRFTLSPGVGYYFIKEPNTTLSAEVGPGVVFERQGGEEDTYLTLRLAEKFEHKFNDRARVWQSAEILPQIDDFDNFIVNAEIGVEAALSERSSLRVLLQNTYDNEPAEGREKNDLKLVSAIVWKF